MEVKRSVRQEKRSSGLTLQSWSTSFGLGLACLLLGITSAPAQAQNAASTMIIPYLDTGYRFKVVGLGAMVPAFEKRDFNDADPAFEFYTGAAGFGTKDLPPDFPFDDPECPLNTETFVKTTWPLLTDILLRKEFDLPSGASNLKVRVAIDNDIQHSTRNGLEIIA